MEYCKGCYVKHGCTYREYSTLCPCGICLIKMVCEEMCDEHVVFQAKMRNGNMPVFNPKREGGPL